MNVYLILFVLDTQSRHNLCWTAKGQAPHI